MRGALGVRRWAFGVSRLGVRRWALGTSRPNGDNPQTPNAQSPRPVAVLRFTAALVLLATIAPTALACPVCWGAPDDPMVKGVNSGIWVLLGLVGFVQIGFVAMFWSFWRKAREHRRFRESLRVIEGGPRS